MRFLTISTTVRFMTDILENRGKEYVRRIQQNLSSTGTDASGETSRSVGYRVYSQGTNFVLEVFGGRPFFPTVETGSKPSKKNPSPAMVESLKQWKAIRGLEASPWAIAKSILKNGSKLWQKGGRKDIYSNVREDASRELRQIFAEKYKQEALKTIKV